MFDPYEVREAVEAQFADWSEAQLDEAEALEYARQEHRKAGCRRRARESRERRGLIKGKRGKRAAQGQQQLGLGLTGSGRRPRRVQVRRKGVVVGLVEVRP